MIKLFSEDKYNIMAQAIINLSKATNWTDRAIYDYLEDTSKTSLVVELVNEMENICKQYNKN